MARSKTQMRRLTLSEAQSMDEAALTVSQTAGLLNLDVRTVHRGIEEGAIPSVRVGARVLIPREPLLALFAGQSTTGVA